MRFFMLRRVKNSTYFVIRGGKSRYSTIVKLAARAGNEFHSGMSDESKATTVCGTSYVKGEALSENRILFSLVS